MRLVCDLIVLKRHIEWVFVKTEEVRKVSKYCDHECGKDILLGFHILPVDLFILRAKLLLYSSALRSNR